MSKKVPTLFDISANFISENISESYENGFHYFRVSSSTYGPENKDLWTLKSIFTLQRALRPGLAHLAVAIASMHGARAWYGTIDSPSIYPERNLFWYYKTISSKARQSSFKNLQEYIAFRDRLEEIEDAEDIIKDIRYIL